MTSLPRSRRAAGCLLVLLVFALHPLDAQVSSSAVSQRPAGGRYSLLSFGVAPFLSIPLGADAAVFSLGGGSDLLVTYRIPALPLLFVSGTARLRLRPIAGTRHVHLDSQSRCLRWRAAGPAPVSVPEPLRRRRLLPGPSERNGHDTREAIRMPRPESGSTSTSPTPGASARAAHTGTSGAFSATLLSGSPARTISLPWPRARAFPSPRVSHRSRMTVAGFGSRG